MTVVDCERTDEILEARRRDVWEGQTAEHVAACAACGDALASERALTELGAALERLASPPDAAQILFRAQLRQRAAATERATRPMRLWGRFVGIGSAAAAGILVVTRGGALWHHLTSPAPAAASASPLLLVTAGASLGLASLLLYLHSTWNET
jgi:hypothetical protein